MPLRSNQSPDPVQAPERKALIKCLANKETGKYTPAPKGGEESANVIWGKNMKMGRERVENARQHGRKGKEKGKKEKETEKRIKRVICATP